MIQKAWALPSIKTEEIYIQLGNNPLRNSSTNGHYHHVQSGKISLPVVNKRQGHLQGRKLTTLHTDTQSQLFDIKLKGHNYTYKSKYITHSQSHC